MKEKFQCSKCKKIFMATGKKIDINDSIYGKGWKWIAQCECGAQAEQYQNKRFKKLRKKSQNSTCSGGCCCAY